MSFMPSPFGVKALGINNLLSEIVTEIGSAEFQYSSVYATVSLPWVNMAYNSILCVPDFVNVYSVSSYRNR